MKKRACFSFRPRPGDPEQQRAWEILQTVPEGQKSTFLVQAILESERKDVLEATLRRILREELKALLSQPEVQQEESIPEQMMGFLGSLMGEE